MGFTFSAVGDYYLEAVINPSQTLAASTQDQLIQQCTNLSRDSFQNPNLNYDGLKCCIIDASASFFIRNREDQLVGFASYSLFKVNDFNIIYMQSSAVSTLHQNKGIWQFLLSSRIADAIRNIKSQNIDVKTNHILIGGRTQNPILYRFLNRKLGCFPNPDGTSDSNITSVARKFAKLLYDRQHNHGSEYEFQFDDDTFVTQCAYKRAYSFTSASENDNTGANIYTYKIPFCEYDEEINNFMKVHVNWERGDAITPLGYYYPEKIDRLLQNKQQLQFA